MENKSDYQQGAQIGMPETLPNATTALVLGIVSIPTCCCGGVVGLVCGILAIVFGSKAMKLYKGNPDRYNISSYNNANAGKICGVIGTVFSSLYLIYFIIYLIIWGSMMDFTFSSFQWENFK
jgi:hypothetical protein